MGPHQHSRLEKQASAFSVNSPVPSQTAGSILVLAPGNTSKILGNLLIILGAVLFLLIAAGYAYARWEELLDDQQRQVLLPPLSDWRLEPLSPVSALAPAVPTVTRTSISLPRPSLITPTLALIPAPTPTPSPSVPYTIPVHIAIPKIQVNSPIVQITQNPNGDWNTAAYAVGYHKGSGLIGKGNIILSGHNNFEGEVFKRLDELQAGDIIKLYAGREYQYRVVEKTIILWTGASAADRRRHVQYLLPTADSKLTLISCWPYWFYTHRIYIVARPIF